LRFNSDDSAYLNRTPSNATNLRVFTFSAWVKLTKFGDTYGPQFITNQNGGVNFSDTISIYSDSFNVWFAGATYIIRSTQVLRDSGSWYHLVAAIDTTQATAANRVKLYINGIEVTSLSSSSYPPQNYDTGFNTASVHYIGQLISTYYSNMYLTEFYWIDGQALTPSSFGETDAITGRWKAKAYSGTYGTNGFYLKFADNSGTTSTTLGKDSSGNSNNWTPNNFSVTVGAGNDSLVDSPTNYGADSYNITVDNSRGNYNTFNPLSKVTTATLTNGNLDAGASGIAIGSIGMTSGKWYWEVTSTGGATAVGLYGESATSTRSVAIGVTEGFRFDASAGTLDYTTNGSTFTSIATGLTSTPYFIYVSTAAATTASLNCGQRLFSYAMPSGYKTLCTTNLTTPTIKKPSTAMDVVTYTGTGASNSISSLGFSPDLVWIKNRGGSTSHAIYDTTRGTQSQLSSDTTGDQVTSSSGLTAFGSNGFTISTSTLVNTTGTQYVAWAWDESTQAGLDVVSYTGNGANRTIAHTLGVAPKMVIVKARTTAGADQGWPVWHTSIANTTYLQLNSTSGTATGADYWNSTSPTSSVFSLGTNVAVNANNDTYISYLFSEIEGYSKFGSYTGNASADGPFVWCGFKPKYIMVKKTSASGPWMVFDSSRDSFNVATSELRPNETTAEPIATRGSVDLLSNGFKIRSTSATFLGELGDFIFLAFAESPFKYARAR
jgi:hypothetical protein